MSHFSDYFPINENTALLDKPLAFQFQGSSADLFFIISAQVYIFVVLRISVVHTQSNAFSNGLTFAQGGFGERAACREGAEAKSSEVLTAGTGQQHRAPHAAAAAAGLTWGQWQLSVQPLISFFSHDQDQVYYYYLSE